MKLFGASSLLALSSLSFNGGSGGIMNVNGVRMFIIKALDRFHAWEAEQKAKNPTFEDRVKKIVDYAFYPEVKDSSGKPFVPYAIARDPGYQQLLRRYIQKRSKVLEKEGVTNWYDLNVAAQGYIEKKDLWQYRSEVRSYVKDLAEKYVEKVDKLVAVNVAFKTINKSDLGQLPEPLLQNIKESATKNPFFDLMDELRDTDYQFFIDDIKRANARPENRQ